MSTRGLIARSVDGGAEGRYHHFDSYVDGLGMALFLAYHKAFGGDLERMQRVLIDEHPAGWSTIIDVDWSLDPGYLEYGNPGATELVYRDDAWVKNPQYENRPRCYCHGDRSEAGGPPTQCRCASGDPSQCSPQYMEYLYVLAEQGLEIWYHAERDDGGYEHRRWGVVPWDEGVVNWGEINEQVSEAMYPGG